MERIDHAKEAIALIDGVLLDPLATLEHSLMHAVVAGTMTIEEANECLDAYEQTFAA